MTWSLTKKFNSILRITENFDNSQTVEQFQFNSETTSEIYRLLKNIGDKKAIGTDKILPKLVKYQLKCFLNLWQML